MASLPEKSRDWLPFPIREIRFIRSAGCSALLPAYPCHRCNPWWIWAQNGVFRRFLTICNLRGPLQLVSVEDVMWETYAVTAGSTTKHANGANGEGKSRGHV